MVQRSQKDFDKQKNILRGLSYVYRMVGLSRWRSEMGATFGFWLNVIAPFTGVISAEEHEKLWVDWCRSAIDLPVKTSDLGSLGSFIGEGISDIVAILGVMVSKVYIEDVYILKEQLSASLMDYHKGKLRVGRLKLTSKGYIIQNIFDKSQVIEVNNKENMSQEVLRQITRKLYPNRKEAIAKDLLNYYKELEVKKKEQEKPRNVYSSIDFSDLALPNGEVLQELKQFTLDKYGLENNLSLYKGDYFKLTHISEQECKAIGVEYIEGGAKSTEEIINRAQRILDLSVEKFIEKCKSIEQSTEVSSTGVIVGKAPFILNTCHSMLWKSLIVKSADRTYSWVFRVDLGKANMLGGSTEDYFMKLTVSSFWGEVTDFKWFYPHDTVSESKLLKGCSENGAVRLLDTIAYNVDVFAEKYLTACMYAVSEKLSVRELKSRLPRYAKSKNNAISAGKEITESIRDVSYLSDLGSACFRVLLARKLWGYLQDCGLGKNLFLHYGVMYCDWIVDSSLFIVVDIYMGDIGTKSVIIRVPGISNLMQRSNYVDKHLTLAVMSSDIQAESLNIMHNVVQNNGKTKWVNFKGKDNRKVITDETIQEMVVAMLDADVFYDKRYVDSLKKEQLDGNEKPSYAKVEVLRNGEMVDIADRLSERTQKDKQLVESKAIEEIVDMKLVPFEATFDKFWDNILKQPLTDILGAYIKEHTKEGQSKGSVQK